MTDVRRLNGGFAPRPNIFPFKPIARPVMELNVCRQPKNKIIGSRRVARCRTLQESSAAC